MPSNIDIELRKLQGEYINADDYISVEYYYEALHNFDTKLKQLIKSIVLEVIGEEPTEDVSTENGIGFSERQFGRMLLWKSQRQSLQKRLGDE